MRPLKLLACVCLAAGGLAVAAGGAVAATPSPTNDCFAHNKLTHHYTISQLQKSLATMPAQIKEYTPCLQVIQDQLNTQLDKGSGSGSGGSGGSFLSGPLIAIVIVIVLAGGGLAYYASRRGTGGGEPPPPPPPAAGA